MCRRSRKQTLNIPWEYLGKFCGTAYAVIYYTEPRYTKDIDIWVEPTTNNAKKVWQGLAKFGAPLKGVTTDSFCNPHLVYQIGIEPNRIDIMMGIPGLEFQKAWKNKIRSKYGDEIIYILNIKDLVVAKKTANRPQDEIDLERLLAAKKTEKF